MVKTKGLFSICLGILLLWVLSQTWGVAQVSAHALDELRPNNNTSAVLVKGEQPWLGGQLPAEWYTRRGVAILPCVVACDVAYGKDHFGNALRKYNFWFLGLSFELSSKFIWQKR
jgi:hypothetical protein